MTHASPASGEHRNLADQAYNQLSGMILHRQLGGGTFLVEERLAEVLQISRTPMREAILRLAAEGLVVKKGSRSYAVRSVTATEFFQSHKVREWLEPEAVELAAPNIAREQIEDLRKRIEILATAEMQERAHWEVDDQLHLLFADASGNAVLANIIRQVRVTTRLFEISNPLRRVHQDGEEHLAILQALSDGDAKGARKAMLRHVRNLVSDTLAILRGL
jgi:DNA-binding GntR family transcriptional regulator